MAKITTEDITAQINTYFTARYGQQYVYRAPETFTGFEQWLNAVAAGNKERAEELMEEIRKAIQG